MMGNYAITEGKEDTGWRNLTVIPLDLWMPQVV
jgi:hypothetical protein